MARIDLGGSDYILRGIARIRTQDNDAANLALC